MRVVAEWFASVTGGHIPPQLAVVLISMVPLLELRGGMIVARILDLPYWQSVICCVLGNIIPRMSFSLNKNRIFSNTYISICWPEEELIFWIV